MSKQKRHLIRNLFYIGASVILAILIVRSGAIDSFLASVDGLANVGSFLAGMFFTSIFTAVPATAVLGSIALTTPPWIVALFGGIGAVCGDYILFLVVREGISRDVAYLVKHTGYKRFHKLFHTRLFHRFLPFVGALILASPLPDEIGLAMLGFSTVNKDRFLLISLAMNTAGIFVVALVARSIAGV